MDIKKATVIIIEREYVGTKPLSEVFNEVNKEVIEQNAKAYLASVA